MVDPAGLRARGLRNLRLGLRPRILLITIFGLAPAAATLTWETWDNATRARQAAVGQAIGIANGLAKQQTEIIDLTRIALTTLADAPSVRNAAMPRCQERFAGLVAQHRWLTDAWITDATGKQRCGDTGTHPFDRSDRPDFIDAMRTGEFSLGLYRIGQVTGRAVIPMSLPVFNAGGRVEGTLGASIDASWIAASLTASGVPPGTLITFVGIDDVALFRNVNPAAYVGRRIADPSDIAAIRKNLPAVSRGTDFEGVARIFGYAELPEIGVVIAVGLPEAMALEAVDSFTRSWLVALLAGALATGLIIWWSLTRLVLRPVAALEEAAAQMQFGNGFIPAAVSAAAGEIGSLGRRINEMAKVLREREAALHDAGEKLSAIMDHTVDGLITIDDRGIVRSFSRPAERIFGYKADEVLGRNVSILMPEPYRSAHDGYLDAYLTTGKANILGIGREVEGQRKDGTTFAMDLAVGEIPSPSGGREFVGTVRDITQRVATEQQLRQARKMDAIGQLTSGVAHDFNNVLAVIRTNLELIADQTKSAALDPQAIEAALRGTRRGADLTSRLLAFSRRMPLKPEPVEVDRLILNMARLLERTLGATVTIETRLSAGTACAFVDRDLLDNALLNLAVNARDAMPQGGRLMIETTRVAADQVPMDTVAPPGAEPQIRISVIDTGVGMSDEVLAHAYEPFFTTKPVGKGTGLGLSMVYGFVKQSGGQIAIDSAVGRGTTVTIYLPQTAAAEHVVHPEPIAEQAAGRHGQTLLLVEDDEGVRTAITTQLQTLGYRVNPVVDGQQALAVLKSSSPIDIVLTDMVLPGGVNGLEVAEEARRLRPGIAVLCMSGYPEAPATVASLRAEGIDLLSKPFTRAQLAAALAAAGAEAVA